MTTGARKFVLDTQLFIQAFRDREANDALQNFHRAFAPFEFLIVIVARELRVGIQRRSDLKALERNVLKIFARANRTSVPSPDAWHRSGNLAAEMANADGLEIARLSKAFANDVLPALSCRESGCVLVTDNERDFARIRRFVPFEFMKPWTQAKPLRGG